MGLLKCGFNNNKARELSMNFDGFVKNPISAEASLRVFVALHPVAIAAYANVRLITWDLRRLELELFTLPSGFIIFMNQAGGRFVKISFASGFFGYASIYQLFDADPHGFSQFYKGGFSWSDAAALQSCQGRLFHSSFGSQFRLGKL